MKMKEMNGGGRGIRTPVPVAREAIFKTAAFNHSAIPPEKCIFSSIRLLLSSFGLKSLAYFLQTIHVRLQSFRNGDRAILVLIAFQDGAHRPP